jgi:hypothetical protein
MMRTKHEFTTNYGSRHRTTTTIVLTPSPRSGARQIKNISQHAMQQGCIVKLEKILINNTF